MRRQRGDVDRVHITGSEAIEQRGICKWKTRLEAPVGEHQQTMECERKLNGRSMSHHTAKIPGQH
jgi:hypothetical protein